MKKKGGMGRGKSNFSDDCGVWDSKSGTSPSSNFLLQDNRDLKKIPQLNVEIFRPAGPEHIL